MHLLGGLLGLLLLGDLGGAGFLLLLAVLGLPLFVGSLGGLGPGLPLADHLHLLLLALEELRSDETLDLRGLGLRLAVLLTGDTPDDVLAHIVGLLEGEQLADVVSPLGTQAAGLLVI